MKKKLDIITCILVSDYLEVVFSKTFFTNVNFFSWFYILKSEIRTVLLEVGVTGLETQQSYTD